MIPSPYGIIDAYQELQKASLDPSPQAKTLAIQRLEAAVENQRDKLIQEVALDPRLSTTWIKCRTLLDNFFQARQLPKEEFQRLEKAIEFIQSEGASKQKIISICNKNGVNFLEYQAFMDKLGASINDVNKETSSKRTPVTYAVQINNPQMVRLLKELGADLNKETSVGWFPIIVAIKKNNLQMVRLLKELGADLNVETNKGWIPITRAIRENNIDMVKLLIKLGADINRSNKLGNIPLTFAIEGCLPEIQKLLVDQGADIEYAKEFINRKLIAHLWGIKGRSKLKNKSGKEINFKLAGFSTTAIIKKLSENVQFFFNSNRSAKFPLSEQAKQIIQECIDKASQCINKASPLSTESNSAIVAKIKQNKPHVILGGSSKHAISIVLCKDKLVVCNRGRGRRANAAEIYSLPAAEVTEEMIKKFKVSYRDPKAFNQMISALNLRYLGGFNQKNQKMGNCTWASAKAAFGVLCRFYSDDEIGKKIYKNFTSFSREKELIYYLFSSPSPDRNLLRKIKKKLETKKELLLSKKILTNIDRSISLIHEYKNFIDKGFLESKSHRKGADIR